MAGHVGQRLGNYRLTRLLERGGFADVYFGEHIHTGSPATVKVLQTELTGDEMEQFHAEAQALARLVHPQIVRLLEFGVEGNTPFLVMDYSPNGSLRQRHPIGERLPLATIVSYVRQIAEALQYAHDQKLIHCDIKPENMLLGRRNEVLLSDFCLDTVAQSSRSQSTLEVAGTVAYAAPEQLQGKPCPASDQYALGVVVYEWLSGDLPFHGPLPEIVSQHLSVPPPLLREKVPTISVELERVVLRALAKEPQNRYSSVREFAEALAAAVEQPGQGVHTPVVAVEPSESTIVPLVNATPPQIAAPLPQKTKEQWLNEGIAHYDAGRYKEAIAAYDYVIALDPRDALAYNNRSNAYYSLGEYQQALADYSRAIDCDPRSALAYHNRGNTYYALKDCKLALADYDNALALDPTNAAIYDNRGSAYADLKQCEKAIADYGSAIALDPRYAPAYNNRGLAYKVLREYKKAIADHSRAIALDPNDALAYHNRGNAYYNLKKYQEAIADYDFVLTLDPNDALAYNNRGLAYKALKEYEKAIADYNRALALNPRYTAAYNNRGLAYYALEQYQQATADYDHAIALDPGSAKAYYNRGNAYKALKEYEKAIADYDRAIELDPRFVWAYSARGEAYRMLNQYQRAIQDFDSALKLDPGYTLAETRREEAYRTLKGKSARKL